MAQLWKAQESYIIQSCDGHASLMLLVTWHQMLV